MKITILGSGSKGNSTLLEIDKVKILIDVGFSYKVLKEKLESVNIRPQDIDYIFITHNHSDHIYGLKTFINKHKPILYISEKIANLLFGDLTYERLNYYTDEIYINEIYIKRILTSHDAIDSNGFLIEYKNESVVYITDTGYIHQRNLPFLTNKTYYIIESNHDIEMLKNGRYPYYLQQRVGGSVGHLSNELCSSYLSKLVGPNTKKIVLAHLSEENNTPQIALDTLNRVFSENNIHMNNIECASQDKVLEVVK
jgi:phosphoribosyl 1,2-cyclic phosphodiesterase